MYFSDDKRNQFEKFTPRVEVFSLRMNKWRPLKNTVIPTVASHCGITVNSTVYWLKSRRFSTNSEGVWILSFDFISEVFEQIKLPDDVCYPLGEIEVLQLMKFEDSLSICICHRLPEINNKFHRPCCIWLISHKDGIVSSTLRFRVVLRDAEQPLNITRGGTLLMETFTGITSDLLSYNLKSMQHTNLEFRRNMDPDFRRDRIRRSPYNVETFFIESLGGDELLTSEM
ncbi:uncharacterized protein LOC141686491 [Apium graveolens]|uniref:uncharacterized protein LOC141686491 n=1 Tax=Apium graveolens TaxID=4045 RepID=UPI003D796793